MQTCSSVWVGIFRSLKVFNIQNASSLKLMRKWRSQQPALSASPLSSKAKGISLEIRWIFPWSVSIARVAGYIAAFFFSCTCVHIKYPTNIYWAFATHQPLCEGCNEQDTCHSLPLQGNTDSRKLVYRLLSRVRWRAFRPRVKNRLLFMNWATFVLLFANRVHLVQNSFSHYKTCGQRQLVIWIRGK